MLDTPSFEVVWRVLATHSIRHFPLHFPSRASPCAITFQLDSTLCATKFSVQQCIYLLCTGLGKTVTVFLHSTCRLVFVTETICVYCAVRVESLCVIRTSRSV